MPAFDWTISIGNILTVLGFVGTLYWSVSRLVRLADQRLANLEHVLTTHTATLVTHAARMEKQDDLMLRLVGDVQRLVGHIEARHAL